VHPSHREAASTEDVTNAPAPALDRERGEHVRLRLGHPHPKPCAQGRELRLQSSRCLRLTRSRPPRWLRLLLLLPRLRSHAAATLRSCSGAVCRHRGGPRGMSGVVVWMPRLVAVAPAPAAAAAAAAACVVRRRRGSGRRRAPTTVTAVAAHSARHPPTNGARARTRELGACGCH
jgi:hypothetical protein